MKKLILIAAMAMTFFAVSAQTSKIKYQAVVRDNNNRLVTNTAVTADVTVTYGSNTYTETGLAATTNANGLMTLEIGNGSGFEAIDWSNATITTTVSFGSQTIENTVTATAVPYALNAGIASDLDPNGTALTTVYSKIQSDSTAAYEALKDTATALRNAIPAPQVNADWDATGGAAQILNKPSINNGTLTITLPDGTTKVFTANQAGNTEVTIPAYTVTPQDILDAAGQLTPEQKAAVRQALGVE